MKLTCPRCSGTGQVSGQYDYQRDAYRLSQTRCLHCNGEGTVDAPPVTCVRCGRSLPPADEECPSRICKTCDAVTARTNTPDADAELAPLGRTIAELRRAAAIAVRGKNATVRAIAAFEVNERIPELLDEIERLLAENAELPRLRAALAHAEQEIHLMRGRETRCPKQ